MCAPITYQNNSCVSNRYWEDWKHRDYTFCRVGCGHFKANKSRIKLDMWAVCLLFISLAMFLSGFHIQIIIGDPEEVFEVALVSSIASYCCLFSLLCDACWQSGNSVRECSDQRARTVVR